MIIGICDDSLQDCLALKDILSKLRPQDEVDCFTEGSALLSAIRGGRRYGCLFLDVLMPGVNGIELIPQIEDAQKGDPIYFVFVSSSRDYAVEAFAYRAAHYLLKPIHREGVAEALRRIPSQSRHKPGITVRTESTSRFLYLDEICLCESSDHTLQIRLINGERVVARRMTQNDILRHLGEDFTMLSRGLIVNMNYIESMEAKSCVLKDGRKILLSRGNMRQIHEAYDNFTFSRLIERGRD